MRLLFDLDRHDYADCTHTVVRNSARAILIRDGKVAMIYSPLYDDYKFPGGGIEPGESPEAAMLRETREEAGIVVVPESVRPYGFVHRIHRGKNDPTECFVQDNFYYLCADSGERVAQKLDDYEAEEGFCLVFVDPETAIRKNRAPHRPAFDSIMHDRDARVLELLMKEGYFDRGKENPPCE